MIRGLATAVSGMITQEAKQDVITNNIANAETVGYKQDNLAIKSFKEVLIQNFDKMSGGKNVRNVIGSLSLGSQIDGTNTDFTPGLIENTGKSTDFAVNGSGFFTVTSKDTNGNTQNFYTRDGNFSVDSKGYLVTDSGDNVMGTNSNTQKVEPIKVNNSTITTDSNNNIYLNGTLSYKFQMADFDKYSDLKKVGDNLYNGATPSKNQNISVKQNSLEKSNVNVMSEMINMMTVLRNYESDQKAIQTIDSTLGKAVNEVGIIK
jgi:flagellar basal-body rod protein FlgF